MPHPFPTATFCPDVLTGERYYDTIALRLSPDYVYRLTLDEARQLIAQLREAYTSADIAALAQDDREQEPGHGERSLADAIKAIDFNPPAREWRGK